MTATLTLPELSRMITDAIRDKRYQRDTRLGRAVAEYLAWARLKLAPRSLEIYEGYLARLCILLADEDPDIGDVRLDQLLRGLNEIPQASLNVACTAYRGLFRWACKAGRVDRNHNPADDLPQPRKRPPRIYNVFTAAEQARIIKTTDSMPLPHIQRLRALCFIELGIRKEEARLLRDGDFDPVGRVVTVTGKGGKDRIVPMSDELFRALVTFRNRPIPKVRMADERGEFKQDRQPLESDYVFFPLGATKAGLVTWTDPTRPLAPRSVHAWWEGQVIARAGVRYRSLHMNRHTVGTDLADADADSFTIRDWLGHADVSTTQVYVHNARGRLQRGRAKLDEYRKAREV